MNRHRALSARMLAILGAVGGAAHGHGVGRAAHGVGGAIGSDLGSPAPVWPRSARLARDCQKLTGNRRRGGPRAAGGQLSWAGGRPTGRAGPAGAEIRRSNLAVSGRIWAGVGTSSVDSEPALVDSKPSLVEAGPSPGQTWSNSSQFWSNGGQDWSFPSQVWSKPGRAQARLGRSRASWGSPGGLTEVLGVFGRLGGVLEVRGASCELAGESR